MVPHPALNGGGPECGRVYQPVAMKEFNETADIFLVKFTEYLGVDFQERELSSGEAEEVKKIEESVKKNVFKKRVVFKQIVTLNSL